jgi:uncharacterized protein (DUF111 family)
MKIAYFDCFAGASGDMILGSMLDAGLDLDQLSEALGKLHLSHFRLESPKRCETGYRRDQGDRGYRPGPPQVSP